MKINVRLILAPTATGFSAYSPKVPAAQMGLPMPQPASSSHYVVVAA